MSSKVQHSRPGFTVVELVIVVIVVGVLAGIVTVAYRGVTADSHEVALRADLKAASAELTRRLMQSNTYPETAEGLPKSDETEYAYEKRGSDGFCLSASSSGAPGKVFYITQEDAVQEGECPPPPPTYIQTITKDACPTERTVVADARDNHTYFIQKLADGQCWMLTNLAYAGGTSNGGANTYSDTISTSVLTNGASDSAITYTEPKYYIHADANPTIHPATPSTSIDGGATNPQYGYFYNWCAAMGA